MANVSPGSNYTPTLTVRDANGSPVTSGVSGTMALYGPTSAGVLNFGGVSHFGNGAWGVTFAGSYLTAPGTYRFNVAFLTTPGGTLADQGDTFEVGASDGWTLRELYTAVRRGLRDGATGTSTAAGTTTTLVCSRYARGSANNWIDSEVFIFEPQNVADTNPVRVTGFAATTGTFTFAPALTAATIAGLDFILGNKEDQGFTHDEVMDAIINAVRRRRELRPVDDRWTIVPAMNTYEYAVPSNWVAVDRIEILANPGTFSRWRVVSPIYYEFSGARSTLRFTIPLWNNSVRIVGRAQPAVPSAMGEIVQADALTIRDEALFELLMASDDQNDRQRAAMLGQGVARARLGAGLARL